MIYTKEEVQKSTLEYFKGDELACNVWINKYCLKDSDGNLYELNPDMMHHRLASEFARIERKYENPLSENEIYELLKDFKYIVPQGSPMAGIGNNNQITSISNCFVIGNNSDSYGGLLLTDQEQIQLAKRRGGIGHNLSHIRPKGSPVKNGALTSTGIVPFMERYSNSVREVAQEGRRGALMLSIDIKSIEVEDFISAKLELDKVTGANISVKVDNEFMNSVKNNSYYIQRFPITDNTELSEEYIDNLNYDEIITLPNGVLIKKIKSKLLWDKLIYNNWKSAEPGILFWDTIIENSTPDKYDGFQTTSTNPCFAYNTLIHVKQNNIEFELSIKELTERFINGEKFEILSYNTTEYEFEYKPLLNALLTKNNAKVLEIKTSNDLTLIVTPEHEIYVSDDDDDNLKKQAKELNESDILITYSNKMIPVYVDSITELDELYDVYDITVQDNHNLFANKILSSNCGEIPLCPYDSCRLLSVNLYNYILNPFTIDAKFNFDLFANHIQIAQRFMDDIVDLELEKIDAILNKIDSDPEDDFTKLIEKNLWEKIKEKAIQGRRTGLGTTALGDCIAALNLQFGTIDANEMIHEIYKVKAINEYKSSVLLAKDRGTFPIYNSTTEQDDKFISFILSLDNELKELHNKYGRRNINIATCAPTGTVSLMTQTTSGIEPLFLPFYKRRKKVNPNEPNAEVSLVDQNGDSWNEFNVVHKGLIDYYIINKDNFNYNNDISKLTESELNNIYTHSPYFNACANDIDYINGIVMQGIIQKFTGHSISRTANLPENVNVETINDLYFKAWEEGCKGFTVYREGSRSGVLVKKEDKQAEKIKNIINTNDAPKRPKELQCEVIRFINNKEPWIGFIGLLDNQPYEIFTGKLDEFNVPNYVDAGVISKIKDNGHGSRYDFKYTDRHGYDIIMQGLNRVFDRENWNYAKMISAILRHGAPIKYIIKIIESLQFENDSEFIMTNWKKGVVRMLKKYIKDGEKVDGEVCPECGSKLVYKEGCVSCSNETTGTCAYSKCG